MHNVVEAHVWNSAKKAEIERKKKDPRIELLRVTAIFFVVFNHTRNMGYALFTELEGGLVYWMSLAFSILCKIGVPVFFMISGGLLLERKETYRELFCKRILRFAFIILVFTLMQYLRIVRIHPEDGFHISTWLHYCYSGNVIEPYWFLNHYFSMLILLPFLRKIALLMDQKDYMFLIWIKVMITGMSVLYFYTGWASDLSFPFWEDIIFYPLLGNFLLNVWRPGKENALLPVRLTGILLICLTLIVWQSDFFFRCSGEHTFYFHTAYDWILASLVFLGITEMKIKSVILQKCICAMGSCVFGVYLIEDIVRNQVQRIVPFAESYMEEFILSLLFTFVSVSLSMAVIWLVKKIPAARHFI